MNVIPICCPGDTEVGPDQDPHRNVSQNLGFLYLTKQIPLGKN